MLADKSRYIPSKGIVFSRIMEGQNAKYAFKSSYGHITKIRPELQRLKQIKDIPCLIIWGKDDKLIYQSDANKFKGIFDDAIIIKKFLAI